MDFQTETPFRLASLQARGLLEVRTRIQAVGEIEVKARAIRAKAGRPTTRKARARRARMRKARARRARRKAAGADVDPPGVDGR